jgi:hypothetical protein
LKRQASDCRLRLAERLWRCA